LAAVCAVVLVVLSPGVTSAVAAGQATIPLTNPSLEVDADGNGFPDCWETTSWGTNTGSWSTTSSAHTGTVAVRGTVTSWTSGDQKLLVDRSGSCAPSATVNAQYTLSAWVNADPDAYYFLTTYWRDSSGSWNWLGQSATMAGPTSGWSKVVWQTPSVPSGATALTVGVGLYYGSVTIDDLSLSSPDAAPANQPPTVQLTAPVDGATVSGSVTIGADASDDGAISRVDFLVNGSVVATSTSPPYRATWNSTSAPNGTATVEARAVDDKGATASDQHQVVVANGSAPATTTVSLTFDDGHTTQWFARGQLLAHGLRGTFYLNSSGLDHPGYLTWAQVAQIAADGNEIGGHSLTHPDLTSLSPSDATTQVCDDRAALMQRGYAIQSFAYPFGASNSTVESIVEQCGYTTGRTTDGIQGSASWCAQICPYAESIPPRNPYQLRSTGSAGPSWPLSKFQGFVTQAEQNGGGWVVFVFHHFCTTSCDDYAVTQTMFAQFLDWLTPRAAQGTVVRTVGDVMGGSGSPPPNTPPTVAITAPAAGSSLSGTVTLAATAQDDKQVARVEFLANGAIVGTATAPPYQTTWASTSVPDGPVDISARAVDSDGATTTATVQANVVNNPPSGSLNAPAANSNLRGTVTLTASTTGSGVASVAFQRAPTGSSTWTTIATDTTSPYTAAWNTTGSADGQYNLRVATTDAAGNSTISATVPVLVDNTAPTGSLTAPAPNANLAGTVTLSASASDTGSGVASVAFQRAPTGSSTWTTIATDTTTPYTAAWNTTGSADGQYNLRVATTDAAGNTTTSATVPVLVGNSLPSGSLTSPAANSNLRGTVTLTASTSGSGVASVTFQRAPTGSSTWTTIATDTTTPYTAAWNTTGSADGQYNLRVITTDSLGNTTTSATVPVRVDNTAPTTSIACNGGSCSNRFRRSVTVTLSGSDSGSGVATIRYTTNGTTPTASSPIYTGPFVLTATRTVRWVAWDAAGNQSVARTQAVFVR
jgi:hypothetical protein